jgi:phenylacetic acid degradation operon negative regulatory protein
METDRLARELVAAFNRRKPVRAGSLIITLYGDAIVPRGGSLSLGDISRIMALIKIDGGHVRTAISRLTTEKWLERKKVGRNTFYRLSRQGDGAFAEATKRIYFQRKAEVAKSIRLALLNGKVSARAAQRKTLEHAGFAPLNAMTFVSGDPTTALKATKGMHLLDVPVSKDTIEILRASYNLDDLAGRYREFLVQFQGLHEALGKGADLSDDDALTIRLLLIQEFRRIVLRDPALPPSSLPAGWPGEEARRLAADIYRKVLKGSERQLDLCQADEKSNLPKPNSQLSQRFTAVR